MFATGGWTWPFLSQPEITERIQWEVYPLPSGPKGQYCQLAGNSYGMNADTPYAEESWQLLKHVTIGEGAKTFFTPENCKGLPATWTLANDPAFLSWFSPESKQTAMEVHKMGTWFPKHPNWQEMAWKAYAELEEIWTGNLAVVWRWSIQYLYLSTVLCYDPQRIG
jgi:ABC-type glycerol-3-phosphate transport system substrate-binding protein